MVRLLLLLDPCAAVAGHGYCPMLLKSKGIAAALVAALFAGSVDHRMSCTDHG